MNVVMINLSYDVPVKLYASHLLLACVFLLATDSPRLVNLLVLNRPTPATTAWEPRYTKPWHRWAALAVYAFFVYQFVIMLAWNDYKRYETVNAPQKPGPF